MINLREDGRLFSDYDLARSLEGQQQALAGEVQAFDGTRLLNTSVDDLCAYFVAKYTVTPIVLSDQVTVDQRDVQVDVSQHPLRDIRDRSRPFHIAGTRVVFHIPFEGDSDLFRAQPSTQTGWMPHGTVEGRELLLSYERTDHDGSALRREFDNTLGEIRQYLGWIEQQVISHNRSLNSQALRLVTTKRDKLLRDQGLARSLGFPLHQRENAPMTYTVPTVKRRIAPRMPHASATAFVPEPTLDAKEYEHILSVIQNMVLVIERSPETFRMLKEEDLRNHFLVQLNAQYEGQAAGETFNGSGKSDILIREKGRNLFIAECKFWDGPKSLTDAVTQLLSYATWRDGKLALLVFNRKRDFSAVLQKIQPTLGEHPHWKRAVDYRSETGWRCIVHHPDDKNRELLLTVLAFEIPG